MNRKQFYKSNAWQVIRRQALKRDNYECQRCKSLGRVTVDNHNKHKTLDVHHIKDLMERPDLAYDIDNLVTVCVKCHNYLENRFQQQKRKENKWAHDEKW